MKIAVWHNLASGGGRRALYDHVSGLVARGHAVEVWSPPISETGDLDLSDTAPCHEVPLSEIHLPKVPYSLDLTSPWRLRQVERHCKVVADEIGTRFDILFANTCRYFATSPLPKYVKCPSVLYLQEPHRMFYEYPSAYQLGSDFTDLRSRCDQILGVVRSLTLRSAIRAESANARKYGSILVNSVFSAESVARTYGIASRVCYLGVDIAAWHIEQHRPKPTVVGIGEVSPHKDILFVIKALSCINPIDRPRLRWIGNRADESYLEACRKCAHDLGLELEITLSVPRDEILDALAEAACLVYSPSLEPFGYVPIEAAAAGIATVAVAEGGIRETVIDGQTGRLVPRDHHVFADAVAELLADTGLARRMGENALSVARQRWDVRDAVGRLEEEFRRVLETGA